MTKDFLSHLPQSSRTEDLETISKTKLSLLLDPFFFEIRKETDRDKGVDMIVEIKQDGHYTNFRFAIQIKASSSLKANSDGSFSLAVETSNINYLLNYGMPAYYILYDHQSGKFYIKSASQVFHDLARKHNLNRRFPENFTIRFSSLLTQEKISEIYKFSFENGTLLRRLNSHLKFSDQDQRLKTGVLIDEDNDVYNVEQNIAFIDHNGFYLLNNYQYTQIIEIEQRTHPRSNTTATFDLICGIAYFQRSSLFKAIEFFKSAQKKAQDLSPEITEMLSYNLLHVKYLLGMIEESAFKKEVAILLAAENSNSFLEIERIYNSFLESPEKGYKKLQKFYDDIRSFITKYKNENDSLLIRTYAQIIEAERQVLTDDMLANFLLLCGRVSDIKVNPVYDLWQKFDQKYLERLTSLLAFAVKKQEFLTASNLCMIKTQWAYFKAFYFHAFQNWNRISHTIDGELSEEAKSDILLKAEQIEQIAKTYEMLEHRENLVTCLSLKYELLHFTRQMEECKKTLERMRNIIEEYELNALKERLQKLQTGGTAHERFYSYFTNYLGSVYRVAKASDLEWFLMTDVSSEHFEHESKNIRWSINEFFDFELPAAAIHTACRQ